MVALSPFSDARCYTARELQDIRGVRMAARFASAGEEYDSARTAAVVFDRSDRGLVILTGADRRAWLHNLVTNTVSALSEHAGVYAFALNVKGRILFDLNILCLPKMLWLDVDAQAVPVAAAHFDRHLFKEDVKIVDGGGQYARLGCGGARAAELAERLDVSNFKALPALATVPLADGSVHLLRHDALGAPGFELVLPRGDAGAWLDRLVEMGARPIGYHTLDLLRIEAGIPWLGSDFADDVLPPETGQLERGVSFHKGCYLGQEVIERMRAHGALARRLVQLRVTDGAGLALPAVLRRDGLEVGRVTSLVPHPRKPHWPGLGYLKTSVTGYADITVGDPPRPVTICSK